MSEQSEVEKLREQMAAYHEKNQKDRAADREQFGEAIRAFQQAMSDQRNLFQQGLSQQFAETQRIDKSLETNALLLRLAIGDGGPGQGRLGKAEQAIELLNKFKWQLTAVVSFVLLLADRLGPALAGHAR